MKKRSAAGEGGAAKTLCMPFDQPGFKLPELPEGEGSHAFLYFLLFRFGCATDVKFGML